MKRKLLSFKDFLVSFCLPFIYQKYKYVIILLAVLTLCPISIFAEPKDELNFPVIVDYMGKNNGEKIPKWVSDIISTIDPKEAKKSLGIKDTDHIFIVENTSDSFDDLLLKEKVLVYVNFIESVLSTIKKNLPTKDESGQVQYHYGDYSSFGCRTITTVSGSDGIIQTVNTEAYYITPFGTMRSSLHYDGKTEYTSRIEKVIEMLVTPSGNLVCPLEYENFFKWFRKEENVKINQFWTKVQMPDKSISYNCLTVMSMSEKDYEKIMQWGMNSLQEGESYLWEENIFH